MKFKSLLWTSLAAVALFAGCEEKVDFGEPDLKLSPATLEFSSETESKTVSITATRKWKIDNPDEYDWIDLGPKSGEASLDPQTITVTVNENTGRDRTADFKVTIGLISKTLKVTQLGQGGSSEPLYFNDFDKDKAEKTFGTGSSWPYLDQFDGWMNQTGTGAANVEYDYSGMSARSNSGSDSNYSDYEGSGINNLFYGKDAHFAVKNIALNGTRNLALTFGTEKYSQDNGSVFTPSEYHVYVSNDAQKWVEIEYEFAGTAEGRWNVATATFTVPEGTENLSLYFGADVASSYRMDDLKLDISGSEGAQIDFSTGVDLGNGGGGGTVDPGEITDITVADFIAAPVDANKYYRLTGTVGGPVNTQYGNFDIIDETGKVYVYGVSNWEEYKAEFAEGGTVVFVGTRGEYNGKVEVLKGYIESYTPGEVVEPGEVTDVTVAEFIAAAVDASKLYRVRGTVVGPINAQYGNYYIEDETGKVYVYGTSNWSEYKAEFAEGGTVVYVGARSEYNGEAQFKDGKIEEYTPGEGGGEQPGGGSGIELTFPDGNSEAISSYEKTWEAVVNGYTWEIKNFNNNNNGWAYIRCGRKNNESVASIANKTVIAPSISSVVVTVDNIAAADKIKDAYMLVATDEAFNDVKETVKVTLAAGDNTYAISNPIENGYYKLVFDCASHTKNGIIQISKVAYIEGEGGSTGGGEVPSGKQYRKITSNSEVTKGSTVLIVCDNASKAVGAFDAGSKSRAGVDVNISNGVVTSAGDALEFTVSIASAKTDAFSFKASDGWLGLSTNDGMSVADEMSGFNIAFQVSISGDGTAELKGVWPNNIVYYFSDSKSFNGLAGKTGEKISLYKLVE